MKITFDFNYKMDIKINIFKKNCKFFNFILNYIRIII